MWYHYSNVTSGTCTLQLVECNSKTWLVELTDIKLYRLYDASCLQNVRTNDKFSKEIKRFSFDKQSTYKTIVIKTILLCL